MFRVPSLIGLLVLAVLLMAADECEVEEAGPQADSQHTEYTPGINAWTPGPTPTSLAQSIRERLAEPTPKVSVWDYVSVPAPARSRDISRRAVQKPFEDVGFKFTRHGSDDFYSGAIWDGRGVTIDLFGPSRKIEAVELWLLVNASNDGGRQFLRSVDRLANVMCGGEYQEQVADWVAESVSHSSLGVERTFGPCECKLVFTRSGGTDIVMLSVEPN